MQSKTWHVCYISAEHGTKRSKVCLCRKKRLMLSIEVVFFMWLDEFNLSPITFHFTGQLYI